MADQPTVLLTGAAGLLGRHLAGALAAEGWTLRLTDIVDFTDPLPKGASFTKADLVEAETMQRLAEGCVAILHFGGASRDRPFAEVIGPNIQGLYNIYEAARRTKARVVFASSNHAIGFHERTTTIDIDDPFRPDTYYGLSKAYGELMGELYWYKHGVETVSLRIGGCFPEPHDARSLATWLSMPDLTRMVIRSVLAKDVGTAVLWGASDNARMTWWGRDDRDRIGWRPQDSADGFTEQLAGKVSASPVAERYMGGDYAASGFTREKMV